MVELIALAMMLDEMGPEPARAFAAMVAEQRKNKSANGEPYLKVKAVADLNADSLVDRVVVFAYSVTEEARGQVQYLSVVVSSPEGYVASWPVPVGARGFRDFHEVVVDGTKITLHGDFTVADGTAGMADLPATGEVYYSYEGGKLREEGGSWTRKRDK